MVATTGMRELTTVEVKRILELRKRGLALRVVADMVGRCHRTVANVEKRRRTAAEKPSDV